jgi:hypothetical protein
MAIEKINDPRRIRHWPGHMETDYIYTHGIAGERFFKEIKENGRITGTLCKRCNLVYVPPRIYCERCFEKLEEWIDVGVRGTVHTFTVAHIDVDGSKLKEPTIYAMIKIHGANGGLVHKLGEINPKDVKIGMQVEAVFKPKEEREGSINDIKHFRPAT